MSHDLRVYDYVNHPYAAVRDALLGDTLGVFQRATTTAQRLHTQLHARLGPVEITAGVMIKIVEIEPAQSPLRGPAVRVSLEWQAERAPGAFPVMHATLVMYALTNPETQLELEGAYAPPLGLVGRAVDAIVGRRIAEASILRFIQDVAAQLRAELDDDAVRQPVAR